MNSEGQPPVGAVRRDLLTSNVGRVLSSSTKSAPIWSPRTPRWILECLRTRAIVPVEGGVFQLNRVLNDGLGASYSHADGTPVETSVGLYNTAPRVIQLDTIQSTVRVSSRVPALFSDQHDQLQSQLNAASEFIYETMENLIFNHSDYGLLNNVEPHMRFQVAGPPTPDVLDDLLALGWRAPDCFVMHAEALAEFRKRANAQSISLEEVELFGTSFTTWRGLPICPTNKLYLTSGDAQGLAQDPKGFLKTANRRTSGQMGQANSSVLLLRFGQAKQGVVCLCAKGMEGSPRLPHINIDFMGLSDNAESRYLLTAYAAMAVLSSGALARVDVLV